MYGINEQYMPALTLIKAAQDFLLQYLHDDDAEERVWSRCHELASAAADVVFSASYVSSEEKHDLLRAVYEKLDRIPRGERPSDEEMKWWAAEQAKWEDVNGCGKSYDDEGNELKGNNHERTY
jgi:hypothetical protein